MTCGCFHGAIPGYFVLRYVPAAFARAPLRRAVIAYRQTTRFAAAWLHDKTYFAPRGSRRRRRPRRLRQLGSAARTTRLGAGERAARGGGKSRARSFLAGDAARSEEHTSELQSLMRISYA